MWKNKYCCQKQNISVTLHLINIYKINMTAKWEEYICDQRCGRTNVASKCKTVCLVLGRAMAWQPNICNIVQSSLYSWTMYIKQKQNKTRYCHLMLKLLPQGGTCDSTSPFSIQPFCIAASFGNSCLYLLKSPFTTCHPSIIFVRLTWFVL